MVELAPTSAEMEVTKAAMTTATADLENIILIDTPVEGGMIARGQDRSVSDRCVESAAGPMESVEDG